MVRLRAEVVQFRDALAKYHEPLRTEFRRAADSWLALAERQVRQIREVVESEPIPQVFRAGDPVNRDLEAFIPRMHVIGELESLGWVDRVMTVEKSIVASWTRTPGFTRDADGRAFAQALARKRVRFAFPDDFTSLAKKLQARLGDKHDKDTDEGRGLRALREIRVCASPSWDAASTEIFFWFIRVSAVTTPTP